MKHIKAWTWKDGGDTIVTTRGLGMVLAKERGHTPEECYVVNMPHWLMPGSEVTFGPQGRLYTIHGHMSSTRVWLESKNKDALFTASIDSLEKAPTVSDMVEVDKRDLERLVDMAEKAKLSEQYVSEMGSIASRLKRNLE